MNSKPFKGTSVFMSRNLVPPEVFNSLHDALKLNGAEVFLCCDPSRNSPDDYHVISSSDHEKFEGLRAKGCNLVGPQCVLACAKERRALPKEGFTCCLAMDGVKVLISGFEMEERGKFGKLVAAMGGSLLTRPSSDVSFVIVKNVIAAKYKWAVHVKKPVVTINWLYQCWNEHRIVPQESYRVPTFSGLIICVTRIYGDGRKEMEKLILQNGGKYSAELTKACTHLICDTPEGDKYKVAKKWGHIRIVTSKWFDQSVSKRACLAEESYQVQGGSVLSNTVVKGSFPAKMNLEKSIGNSESTQPSVASDSNFQTVPSSGNMHLDLETTLSQSIPVREDEREAPQVQPEADVRLDDCVANDSDDDDLYLSDCKICLVGFDATDMRRLVNMIRKGGGSRYTSYSERMTHIVVGSPSDVERKELRGLAAAGVIYVVHPSWLEGCDCAKKEIPVMQKHMAHDALLPKVTRVSRTDLWHFDCKDMLGSSINGYTIGKGSMKLDKVPTMPSSMSVDPSSEFLRPRNTMLFEAGREQTADVNVKGDSFIEENLRPSQTSLSIRTDEVASQKKNQQSCNLKTMPCNKSSGIFMGKLFCFSKSFPFIKRDEVVEWINEGGGTVVDDNSKKNVDFTVECHGASPQSSSSLQTTHVSSHWVRSCLEMGVLLDVASHVLYSPLPCQIPLPGFERFRLCVSQYEEKDRRLLRNLCFVLGAKFGEKLTKRVTHLICKFSSGPKYEACPKWGIEPATCEWIYECIRKDEVVALDSFRPKEPSDKDVKAGLCTLTQYPTQAVRMIIEDNSSQLPTQSLNRKTVLQSTKMRAKNSRKEADITMHSSKKAKLLETVSLDNQDLFSESDKVMPPSSSSRGGSTQHNPKENSGVPDVAAAIEDLLEQTTKIHDMSTPVGTESEKNVFSSEHPTLSTDPADSHTAFGPSTHWLSRVEKQDEPCKPSRNKNQGAHDGFTETQTESQLVGYEEDLLGRQMIIERVRTRSSFLE